MKNATTEGLVRLFERHASRRRDRVPTLSCLVGADVELAWRVWIASTRRALVVASVSFEPSYLEALEHRDRETDGASLLAERLQRSESSVRATLRDRTLERRLILERIEPELRNLAEVLSNDGARIDLPTALRVVPEAELPALLIVTEDLRALEEGLALAVRAPSIPIALRIAGPRSPLFDLESRLGAALRDGMVRAELEEEEASEEEQAKSAAELFLYRLLESVPETKGRFLLNERLDVDFGGRPAEVDLLCRTPPVAIEIDGFFHFLGGDAYRRDRRKDLLLQRTGFTVVRFLAQDVVTRMEEVLQTIKGVLR